jgi:hypothetical protein
MHLARYADQGSKFLQCIVTGDATWVNHAVRETKNKKQKKSMTSQQRSFPNAKKFRAAL